MMVAEAINVGLADIQYAAVAERLKSIGLGSCVGVVIYHPVKHYAGMAHVMLPDSLASRTDDFALGKFANIAVQTLVRHFVSKGFVANQLKAKIAGGAEMFKAPNARLSGRIGPRNVEAVKKELSANHIQLIAEDTGGQYGRTIEFRTESGELYVRTIHLGEKTI